MKRGIFSIDAMIAILLILFILIWAQGLITLNFKNTNSFGGAYEAKAYAMSVGSEMNAMYAGNLDEVSLKAVPEEKMFSDTSATFTAVKILGGKLTTTIVSRDETFTGNYPTANLQIVSGKITK